MKTNDQKQLEFLYEQQVNQPFKLLDQEKKYFDKVSDQLTEHIVSKASGLTKFADAAHIYNQKKTLTTFDDQLFVESLPWFFDKVKTTKLEFAVNNTYKNWIVHNALTNVHVTRGEYSNSSPIKLVFKNPHNQVSVTDRVDITDESGIKEALKKCLIKTLEMWYDHFGDSREEELQNMWCDWRTSELKYRPLKDKLPELEGIF